MSDLIEKNKIQELKCGSNFAYIFTDESKFLSTEYKVLQSPWNEYFVPCMLMKYNGNPACYYNSGSWRPLESMLPSISADNFFVVAINILNIILAVKSNGFLSCKRIETSFERIYVDIKTMNVRMIYIPLNETLFDDDMSFESTIRSELIKQMINNPEISSSSAIQKLTRDLQNGKYTIEDICSIYSTGQSNSGNMNEVNSSNVEKNISNSNSNVAIGNQSRAGNGNTEKRMRLIALNAPLRVEIEINKNDFVLGKKEGMVDAVISFNKMISRVHCRVLQNGEAFYVERLERSNGTFVNDKPLSVNEKVRVINGDTVRMADSDFRVEII